MSYVDLNSLNPGNVNTDLNEVRISGNIGGITYRDITTKEIVVGETILNPALMTSITFQSAVYTDPSKNFDNLKNKNLVMNLRNGFGDTLGINLKVFRLDNRSMMPVNLGRTEEFTIHACHNTMLEDAKHLMNKSWKCSTPSDIVNAALNCVSAGTKMVLESGPARDYIAENIHPYQVIQQQCNAALDGNDPSFVHYMTHAGGGTHHFRSLKNMFTGPAKRNFEFRAVNKGVNTNSDYNSRQSRDKVIVFEIPCQFDLLTDLLNGVNEIGVNINSLTTFNFVNMAMQALGGATQIMQGECYIGANMKQSMTNKGGGSDYGCSSDVESHLLLRQARMALLEKDKIALRLTVPWAPDVHAGDKIRFNWFSTDGSLMPESNEYVVVSLMHKIQFGGFSTTSFDCIKTRY